MLFGSATLVVVCIAVCAADGGRQKRLLKGDDVSKGSHPWMAFLTWTKPGIDVGDRYQFCGATIINRCWILTARNCFRKHKRYTNIYLGAHDITFFKDGKTRKFKIDSQKKGTWKYTKSGSKETPGKNIGRIQVKHVIHSGLTSGLLLIRTKLPITVGSPIALSANQVKVDCPLHAYGWGYNQNEAKKTGSFTKNLQRQESNVAIVVKDKWRQMKVHPWTASRGDLGGPFVGKSKENANTLCQAGVIMGKGEKEDQHYDISGYLKDIEETITNAHKKDEKLNLTAAWPCRVKGTEEDPFLTKCNLTCEKKPVAKPGNRTPPGWCVVPCPNTTTAEPEITDEPERCYWVECPGEDATDYDRRFADNEDCERWCHCDAGGNAWRKYCALMQDGNRLHWHETKKECLWPWEANCNLDKK